MFVSAPSFPPKGGRKIKILMSPFGGVGGWVLLNNFSL